MEGEGEQGMRMSVISSRIFGTYYVFTRVCSACSFGLGILVLLFGSFHGALMAFA